MTIQQFLFIAVIVLGASIIQALFGFGFGLISVPLMIFFVDLPTAVVTATAVPTTANPSIHRVHAITGFICNNKKFIVDPNLSEILRECDWTVLSEVAKLLPEISKPYGHVYTRLRYD